MSSTDIGDSVRICIALVLAIIQIVIIINHPVIIAPVLLIGIPLWVSLACYIQDANMEYACTITGIIMLGSFIFLSTDVVTSLIVIHAMTIVQMICVFPLVCQSGNNTITSYREHKKECCNHHRRHRHNYNRCSCGAVKRRNR
jgi:hypothetical protein